ncbi:hypothetical protein GQ42DRAFT_158069 [Ramicandelaber brevisporus]|nr:hypothetical protein GQ42DRAFT_158069 [Ramicandelaber brevisporus]
MDFNTYFDEVELQRLYFGIGSCGFLDRCELNYCEHEAYNWKAEYSGYAHIIVPSQRWQCLTGLRIGIVSSSILMDIIGFNLQLEYLYVGLDYLDAPVENDASKYNHDEFQLDAILDRLPHLVDFSIGRLNSRVVADSAAIPLKRRYNLRIGIGCQMSIAPSAAVYILQMSRLTSLSFIDCVFADIYETIQMLQNKTVACGVKGFQWYPIVWNQDLALVVTEKMPQLEYFLVDRCPKKYRNAFKLRTKIKIHFHIANVHICSSTCNDSQQVSQQLQSERSTLPLLYLPYELAEETSLYFQPMEAARVLSVSRSFYNLFIPRVWRNLQDCYSYGDRDNFEQWLQKYGQYVRLVDPMLLAIP